MFGITRRVRKYLRNARGFAANLSVLGGGGDGMRSNDFFHRFFFFLLLLLKTMWASSISRPEQQRFVICRIINGRVVSRWRYMHIVQQHGSGTYALQCIPWCIVRVVVIDCYYYYRHTGVNYYGYLANSQHFISWPL